MSNKNNDISENSEIDNEHGNSLKSKKKQHIYEIRDKEEKNGNYKYGVSGDNLNKNGTSKRANKQVNKANKKSGWQRFWAIILRKNVPNRKEALDVEKKLVNEFAAINNGRLPKGMKKPKPEKSEDK